MAVLTFNLPVPAGDGAGAAVDVSTLGGDRTVVVGGSLSGVIHVEVSNEAVPTSWAEVASFPGSFPTPARGKKSLEIAARWMRARVTDFVAGAGNVDVGGDDAGSGFLNLPAPAGNGTGAAVVTAGLEVFRSVTVGGTFTGSVLIEVSEDNVSYGQCMVFGAPGVQSMPIAASFMRVRRANITPGFAGLPLVNVGGAGVGGGGLVCGFTPTAVPFADVMGCLTDDVAGMFYVNAQNRLSVDNLSIPQLAQVGGTPIAGLLFTGAAHTDLANAEAIDIQIDIAATVNFVGGGVGFAQRAVNIRERTYTADAGQVIDVGATFAIQGAPVAGANITLTERYALWVGAGSGTGMSRFDRVNIGAVSTDAALGILLQNLTSAALGAQQFSPMFVFEGQGFATTPAVTREVQFGLQVATVQGAADPSGELRFFSNINDAGFIEQARLDTIQGTEETSLWLRCQHVLAMRRVSVNPADDSGGTGFRALRVPNA